MKQVQVTIGSSVRVADAYEYPTKNEPKSDAVKTVVNGQETRGRTTSGRGKSAIPNFYIYFIEGDKLFYFKSTAAEVAEFRKGEAVIIDKAAGEQPKADPAPAGEQKPQEEPKARRQRVKA